MGSLNRSFSFMSLIPLLFGWLKHPIDSYHNWRGGKSQPHQSVSPFGGSIKNVYKGKYTPKHKNKGLLESHFGNFSPIKPLRRST